MSKVNDGVGGERQESSDRDAGRGSYKMTVPIIRAAVAQCFHTSSD